MRDALTDGRGRLRDCARREQHFPLCYFSPSCISWSRRRMRMCRGRRPYRRLLGSAMVLLGVLLVFVCLPVQLFLIATGVALAAAGLVLLGAPWM